MVMKTFDNKNSNTSSVKNLSSTFFNKYVALVNMVVSSLHNLLTESLAWLLT